MSFLLMLIQTKNKIMFKLMISSVFVFVVRIVVYLVKFHFIRPNLQRAIGRNKQKHRILIISINEGIGAFGERNEEQIKNKK